MMNEDKITEIFFLADEFCQIFNLTLAQKSIGKTDKRSLRKPSLSESEIIAILISFHLLQHRNLKHFYTQFIAVHKKKDFPGLVSYNRFVELSQRVVIPMTMFLHTMRLGACTGISFVDSSPLLVCNNRRIHSHKVFKGIAERGKSSTGWFYGFKLHLIINDRGEILNFAITKGNTSDKNKDLIMRLVKDVFGKMYGDKGYISQPLFDALFQNEIHLVTKIKSNMKNVLMPLRDKVLLRKRAVIESALDILKNGCQIEHSRHRSFNNFIANLMAGLLAYSFLDKRPSIAVQTSSSNQLTLWN